MAETSSHSKLQMKNSKFRSMLYTQKLTQELLELQKSATLCDVELVCQDATISGKTATLCDVQLVCQDATISGNVYHLPGDVFLVPITDNSAIGLS